METEQEAAIDSERKIQEIRDALSPDRFREWYGERQYRENIENGTPYFNGPASIPEPERHSPSSLLQCHRKALYRQCNTPTEQPDPNGIFWFGTMFEEKIALPFLQQSVTGTDTYARNSIWIDSTVETDVGELRIKGSTDPVIVDAESIPILPTEVKTKSSLDNLDSPNRHHCAQVHAYLFGLSKKYDIELTEAAILYGSRKSLDILTFHVEFDKSFWEDVVIEWASEHTEYRLNNELPPALPEFSWECGFCDYYERCGKGETNTEGIGVTGFLPLFDGYPRESAIEYLEANDGAKLTPTLAYRFPDIASQYGSYDWTCPVCGVNRQPESVDWDGDTNRPPLCGTCGEDGIHSSLSGPFPESSAILEGHENV
ncbi:Dna2/Cas4 domain-containing protein [Haloarcula sp. Atlit-7R]|uniref:CRISPR-associated protein Cas4 n=1 Tax=Haloarcula sp. Atlit-7R TaxID=2282125 RepID=UPI000EF16E2E|nr:Dna2/Cas4 domain-containing protein [Haloarcula sp. Atlit-7R]RLM96978.1 Dna2/Cas4 domain-containing protein [Haloarcula sp. Atlit-7R]